MQQHSKVIKKATAKPDSRAQVHKSTREVHFANWIVIPSVCHPKYLQDTQNAIPKEQENWPPEAALYASLS